MPPADEYRVISSQVRLIGDRELTGAADLAQLPTAEGFWIGVHEADGPLGARLAFHDRAGATLAFLACHDHADSLLEKLARETCAATTDQLFHDLDQGWELAIWSDASWTYVMAGDGEPHGQYHTRVRVPVAEFHAAWQRAIAETPRTSFRSLAEAIAYRDSAKALILWHQGLTQVPAELFALTSLEHLDLGLNQLVELPGEIGRLRHLRTLELPFNQLTTLPPELAGLERLESVNLAENALAEIPAWVARMPALKTFFVPENPIAPESLEAARRARPDVEFTSPLESLET